MAGLRGQDEIDAAFADLEYIPGSKKKRRDLDPKVSRRKSGESNGWDANPVVKTLGGVGIHNRCVSTCIGEDNCYYPLMGTQGIHPSCSISSTV